MRRLTESNLVERAMEWRSTVDVPPACGALIVFRTVPGGDVFTTTFTEALRGQWRHATPKERDNFNLWSKSWATATQKLKRKRGARE